MGMKAASSAVPKGRLPSPEPVQESEPGPDAVDTKGVHFQANCSLCKGTITQCLCGWMADCKQAAVPGCSLRDVLQAANSS